MAATSRITMKNFCQSKPSSWVILAWRPSSSCLSNNDIKKLLRNKRHACDATQNFPMASYLLQMYSIWHLVWPGFRAVLPFSFLSLHLLLLLPCYLVTATCRTKTRSFRLQFCCCRLIGAHPLTPSTLSMFDGLLFSSDQLLKPLIN